MRRLNKTCTLVALLTLSAGVAVGQDAYPIAPATYETPAQPAQIHEAEVGANRSAGEPPAVAQPGGMPLRRPALPAQGARQLQDKKVNTTFTVIGSLGLVLGLFFAATWLFKRSMPGGMFVLPPEVLEVLGKAVLGSRQQVQLIRVGNKLLLVAVTPAGVETLTEISDASEIARLTGLCRGDAPDESGANAKGAASRRPARSKGGRRVAAQPSDVFEPSLAGGRRA